MFYVSDLNKKEIENKILNHFKNNNYIPKIIIKIDSIPLTKLGKKDILKLKKSNIGWRKILLTKNFENSYDSKNSFYYFNHNYYFDGKKNDIFAYVCNMRHVPAIITKNNLFGIQFHPEKSHAGGIQILHKIINHL